MRFRMSFSAPLLAALLTILTSGCGGDGVPTATVSGTANYGGKPVEEGFIQFTPVGGKGAVSGGPIKGGKFSVEKVAIGSMTVFVSSSAGAVAGPGGAPLSTEDQAKIAAEKLKSKKKDAPVPVAIPDDALGNNVLFEVKSGTNTLQIDLTPPTGKAASKN